MGYKMRMKLCVYVERSPLYPVLLHRDGARALTYGEAHGDPSPHTQAEMGVGGTHKRERTRSRDHVTCYVIARTCHVTVSGRRGGGPTSTIGGEMRALGLLLPYAAT